MPMYAYACKDCGHAFDIQQSFSDDSLTACPECGGLLRKKFNSVGVVFKGSGFYRNDSRDAKTSTDASASESPSKATADAAGSSSTKTAAKSESTAAVPASTSGAKSSSTS